MTRRLNNKWSKHQKIYLKVCIIETGESVQGLVLRCTVLFTWKNLLCLGKNDRIYRLNSQKEKSQH